MKCSAILNVEIECTKIIPTVGANVPTTSGKDIEITNSQWNIEEKIVFQNRNCIRTGLGT